MLIQNYIPFMCLLFSRDVFAQVRFDERFEIFEDWMLLIALSQTYWFEHIHRITARYNQWSDESQINRRALLEDFSREAYQRVLSENKEKISPLRRSMPTVCIMQTNGRDFTMNLSKRNPSTSRKSWI